MSNNLPPLTFLECHYRAEQLIMNLHDSNNREEVLIQLNNFIIQQAISEAMHMDLGFQLWNSPLTGDKNVRSFYAGLQLLWSEHDQISKQNMSTTGLKEVLGE
ncbi:hypothetical protein H5410_028298 [Solanum commersonii]|uniref:Uncharacterized protein n=1 Tax=Solanum commersonii TaxID=4109 RepID=A0A9J5Z730_SOLCO|nr:hypothetical protein H5410_028298 [Solanum commersonii]